MTDREIIERAKEAEKRMGFVGLVHSPISKGVNSAFGIGFIEGMVEYRNSLQEEPKSKFEQSIQEGDNIVYNEDLGCRVNLSLLDRVAKKEEPKKCMYTKDNYTDEDRKVLCDGCEEECEYTQKEELVSEDLEAEIKKAFLNNECSVTDAVSLSAFTRIARHFANWQKQQMMKGAIEREVKIDAGGYPYINCDIEFYDYDKDNPLAKKGEKVKLIIIKEN